MKRIITVITVTAMLAAMLAPLAGLAAELNEYDNDNALIIFRGFGRYEVSGAYGPTVHSAPGAGAIMQAAFSDCTEIHLYGSRSVDRACADIYIDGELVEGIDTYKSVLERNVLLFSISGLEKGEHVLQVVVLDERNPASVGGWVELDMIKSDGILIEKELQVKDPEEGNQIIDDALLSYSNGWYNYTMLESSRGFYKNTASSTLEKGEASYTFAYCTGIRWYSTVNASYGEAEVYIDGRKAATVNVGKLKPSAPCVVFDSGELEPGEHSITIVKTKTDDKYIEIDRIIGVGENKEGVSVVAADNLNFFSSSVKHKDGSITLTRPGQRILFSFNGEVAKLIGDADAVVRVTLDGIFKGERSIRGSEIIELDGFNDGMHFLQLELASGSLSVRRGYVKDPECVASILAEMAEKELEIIEAGEKQINEYKNWRPVSKGASMPTSGVSLNGGIFKTVFDRNIKYLKHCAPLKKYVDMESVWTNELAASTEGRMMAGIGNTLRWVEDEELEGVLDKLIADIKARTGDDGWCMPYPKSNYGLHPGSMIDEDKNYDRVMFTRGLVAAGKAGNADALELLRNFYDYFDDCEYLPNMLRGGLGTQGSLGTVLAYESPVGKPEDLYVNMRYYDMDWWLDALARRIPEAIYRYPLNRPHSYLIVSMESFLAQYAATGEQKYLDAVLGAWDIFNEHYRNVGGGICICEGPIYRPGNYTLEGDESSHGVYENCGHVFWIELNARLLELFPNEEKYAAQIEETVYNMVIASQAENGFLRYHQLYNGKKWTASAFNTCCENMATGLIASLPQYVWSVADDGIYVNMYTSSDIKAEVGGKTAELTMESDFPYSSSVRITVNRASGALYVRLPSWNGGDAEIFVNGASAGKGKGCYFKLEGLNDGDIITFTLSPEARLNRYEGETVVEGKERYALTYGPILFAAQGRLNFTHTLASGKTASTVSFNCSAEQLEAELKQDGLTFTAEKYGALFVPYMTVQNQTFAVFPVLERLTQPDPTDPPTQAPTADATPDVTSSDAPASTEGNGNALAIGVIVLSVAAVCSVVASRLARRSKK